MCLQCTKQQHNTCVFNMTGLLSQGECVCECVYVMAESGDGAVVGWNFGNFGFGFLRGFDAPGYERADDILREL